MVHTSWPLVSLLALLGQELPSGVPLELGRVVFDALEAEDPTLVGRGPAKRFELEVADTGPVTITAQSYDFDAFLRVVDNEGRLLAEDDDGGFETNPRIVVSLDPGTYTIIVAAPTGRTGSFEVRVGLGATAPLAGLALDIVRTGFLQQSLERAIDRSDEAAAGRIGVRLGNALHATRQNAAAQSVLREARGRLETAGDNLGVAEADLELGRILLALGEYPNAAEHFERSLTGLRDSGRRANEVAGLLGLGDVFAKRSEYDSAADRYDEALDIADQLAEPSLRAYAIARQGTLALARGDLDRARELLTERLDTVRRLGDRTREAGALTDLARLELALRAFDPATALLDEALATYRELGVPQGEARALFELGRAQIENGAIDSARETLEHALSIARENQLAELEVVALHNLGTFWQDIDKYDTARALYAEALALAEELRLAGEVRQLIAVEASLLMATDTAALEVARPRLARALEQADATGDVMPAAMLLRVLAHLDRLDDDFPSAQAHLAAAREAYERLGWNDAGLRVEEGWMYRTLGRPVDAERTFQEVLTDAGPVPDPLIEMLAREGLGRLHHERGEYLTAYRHFVRSLELARVLARKADEATALRHVGSISLQLGDTKLALEYQEQARDTLETLREQEALENPIEWIGVHVELGRTLAELERYDEAEASYAEAGALAEQHAIRPAQLFVLAGMAYVKLKREDYVASLALHGEALELARSLGATPHIPVLLGTLSATYLGLESYVDARKQAEASLAAAQELPAWEPVYTLEPLYTLTALARRQGLVDEGFALLEEAYDRVYEVRGQAVRAGLTPDSTYWLRKLDRLYQDLSRQRERDLGRRVTEDDLVDAFRKADTSRARDLLSGIVQLERGARSREAEARRAELAVLYEQWADLAERRRDAIRDTSASNRTATLRAEARQLRQRIDALELALTRISPPDAALITHEGADPDALRATALGPGRALILYAEGELDLYAYVLTSDDLTVHKLGPSTPFGRRSERYVDLLGDRSSLGTPAEIAALGGALYTELCAKPLRSFETELEHLIIVPTPTLASLPFGALVVEASEAPASFDDLSFVSDRQVVTYGPAGSVLLRIAERGPRRENGKVLVLADPMYESDTAVEASAPTIASSRAPLDVGRLPRLIKSREEAFSVAEPLVRGSEPDALARLTQLRSERSGALEASSIDLFIGTHASAGRLLERPLLPYSWIHLAVHGYVDRESPNGTGVVLAPDSSGLAFVTVADILGLELDAELVVLSACETARGELRAGEGIESMASAFLYAGARSVIASLWQVDDAVTAETMKAFYEEVLGDEGRSIAGALRAAQSSVRAGASGESRTTHPAEADPLAIDPKHPYFWAAFIHIGLP